MQEHIANKFAALMANCAINGQVTELRKEAAAASLIKKADPTVDAILGALQHPAVYGGLLGTGVGGLSGFYGTQEDDRKKRRRNALYGALTGGLSGAGMGAVLAARGAQKIAPGTGNEKSKGDKPNATATDKQQTETAPVPISDFSTNNPEAKYIARTVIRGGMPPAGTWLGARSGGSLGALIGRNLPVKARSLADPVPLPKPEGATKPGAMQDLAAAIEVGKKVTGKDAIPVPAGGNAAALKKHKVDRKVWDAIFGNLQDNKGLPTTVEMPGAPRTGILGRILGGNTTERVKIHPNRVAEVVHAGAPAAAAAAGIAPSKVTPQEFIRQYNVRKATQGKAGRGWGRSLGGAAGLAGSSALSYYRGGEISDQIQDTIHSLFVPRVPDVPPAQ